MCLRKNILTFFLGAGRRVWLMMQKIDVNHDGLITFEELSQWCTREERFVKSLGMLDTVLWNNTKQILNKQKRIVYFLLSNLSLFFK